MDTSTPPYYTHVRICVHCRRYFTEGEQLGQWQCVRHLRRRAFFHPAVPSAHACCTATSEVVVDGAGRAYPGCVYHDHEDADMEEAHATAVLEHNVNIEAQPRILFSRLGVGMPERQSIIAEVSAVQMRKWNEGRDLESSRRRLHVAMGETELDLRAIGLRIAKKTLAGPYGTLARAEDSDMRISEQDGIAFVRSTSEFRPTLPDTDEGGAVVTMDDYYANERHRLEQEQGEVEAVSFVVFSRESFRRLPAAETQLRANLTQWNCHSLGEWQRQFSNQLRDVLYADKLIIL